MEAEIVKLLVPVKYDIFVLMQAVNVQQDTLLVDVYDENKLVRQNVFVVRVHVEYRYIILGNYCCFFFVLFCVLVCFARVETTSSEDCNLSYASIRFRCVTCLL